MSLAIECGATNSTAVYIRDNGTKKVFELGPANFKILPHAELKSMFANLKTQLANENVNSIGIGMPGLLSDKDKHVNSTR